MMAAFFRSQWLKWLLLSGGVVLLSYVLLWRIWVVKTVVCVGVTQAIPDTACKQLRSLLVGQPLLWLDLNQLRWSEHKMVKDQQQNWWYIQAFNKKLPQTIQVQLAETKPTYRISSDGQSWQIVNVQGMAKTEAQPAEHSLLSVQVATTWPTPVLTDTKINSALHTWLVSVVETFGATDNPPTKIMLTDPVTIELFWSNWSVLLTQDQIPSVELQRLTEVKQVLQEKNQALGTEVKQVDLRFKLPVLRTNLDSGQKNLL
jgi:hypothetical protein